MNLFVTIIMILGAVCIAVFSLPNLIRVIKTKNTVGINLPMYIIFTFACIMFSIYGFGMTLDDNLIGGLPVLLSNLLCVAIAIVTLCIKFKNISRAKKTGLTELKYWEQHHKKTSEAA
jgi:uncharacterized protein with PQ loop repeat